jgi:putative GTP pyrophosphokinase
MILEKESSLRLDSVDTPTLRGSKKTALLKDFVRINHIYHSAMQTASTQLEILDSEFTAINDHSPIHHMECRVKTLDSILEKMTRKGYAHTADNMYKIQDIAGIRVICNYVDDIYYLRDLLADSSFRLIRECDYIKNPKPNGYRSLHLIVSVPFMISEGQMELPVEIQLRTIAMDLWASLEHEMRYKSGRVFSEAEANELLLCSQALTEVDQTMQRLFKTVTD